MSQPARTDEQDHPHAPCADIGSAKLRVAGQSRSQSDLELAGLMIGFELTSLVGAHLQLERDPAFLEVSLMHGRILIEFLIGRGRPSRANDMTPDDFVKGWTPGPEPEAKRLLDHLNEIDKHLAHLTWQRVEWANDPAASPWEYPELADDVVAVFDDFATYAYKSHAVGSIQLVMALQVAQEKLRRQRGLAETRS